MNKLIKEYKNIIDTRLSIVYPNGPKLLKEPINHILHGGKRIRPLLCMLVNDACNGKFEDVIDVSVSIELLHIFSLVHDDIMDDDHLRHGITTIHEKWDNSIAILSGDAILALAFKGLNSSPNLIKQKFNSALIAVCEGQALDIEYQNLDNISLNQYYEMINLKTAYMLGLSSEIGALLANQNSKEVDKFKKIGLLIGKVFQIQDDLLEIYSDSNNMGKSLESDLLLAKKTYLMIQAKEAVPFELNSALELAQENFTTGLEKVRTVLIDSGIRQKAEEKINSTIKEADLLLSELNIDIEKLSFFSNLITNRGN